MSVIQNIRNKYIGFVIGSIVVALVGFLVMDAMQSNTRNMFGNDNTKMGDINGTRIDYKDYETKRTQYETNLKSRSKEGVLSEEERKQATTAAWDDMVNDIIIGAETEKLGIDLTDKELTDMLYSPYADANVQQGFRDEKTGVFNPELVKQHLQSLGQDKTGGRREEWKNFEEGIIRARKMQKYNDLITKGIYVPAFVVNHTQKLDQSKANISYVQIPYTTISDSTIKVSDDDVTAYINKNKKTYTAQESYANIEYVAFDIVPSAEDTATSLGVLTGLRDTFMKSNASNLEALVANNSEDAMMEKYFTESEIQMPNPTEVLNATLGTVIGPVFMNGSFKMVKVLDKKSKPDSARASHILIKIGESHNEEQAKLIIDSLEQQVKAGANLAMLAQMRSDDGSKDKGGDLGYFGQGQMVPEFNDACFDGKVGDLKVVKTQFGYHLIKITDQKAFKPATKLAIMSKSLVAGSPTTQAVYAKANEFIAKAKDATTFTSTAKTQGKDKRIAEYITPTATNINGVGNSRELSRWAFEAKIGDVSQVFNLDDKCVVANLTSRQEKGELLNAKAVKPQIEGMIRNEKKAKQITDKYKGKSSLEDIATMAATTVKTVDSISYQGGSNPEVAGEPKLIGAAFNKTLVNKMSPSISGTQGVYFMKVNNIIDANIPKDNPMMNMMKQQMSQQMTQSAGQMIPYILKQKAKIVDNRGKFL
jgi:peptidyl-prolyl cis-trans isomerase D